MNKAELRRQVRLGECDELTKRGVRKTGTPKLGGSMVTADGLVFIAATNNSKFCAFDKDTGEELWVTRLPASGHATPMTYQGNRTGRQFVEIAASGGNKYNTGSTGKLVVFALPEKSELAQARVISAITRPPSPRFRADYQGVERSCRPPWLRSRCLSAIVFPQEQG